MEVKCFRCKGGYDSQNPDDIEGDGKCPKCEEISKKIAFQVDIKMAEYRKLNPPVESRIKQLERLKKNGWISARDLVR